MVKITNGVQKFEVPKGAFNAIFKAQGFYPVDEESKISEAPKTEKPVEKQEPEKTETVAPPADGEEQSAGQDGHGQDNGDNNSDGLTDDELLLKPVEEMTKEELKRTAKIKGVEIAGKKGKEIRALLLEVLSEKE